MNISRILFVTLFFYSTLFSQTDSLQEIKRQIDILTQEIEQLKLGEEITETPSTPTRGLGAAASKVYSLKKTGVSLAGYGEVLYQNHDTKRDDGVASTKTDQIDFLRNIIYVGYRYNDWILFNSEIEIEHGSTGKGGEVSVEFGYVELMFNSHFNLRAGMVLSPLGITNEKHEPSLFLPTLRPETERLIIPSTWRANGFGLYGEIIPSLNYRAYVMEGLRADKFSDADGIRGGRQSGAQAIAENFAIAAKLEYAGFEGATIGASFYQGNSGQGAKDSLGAISASTSIVSAHAEFAWKGLEARALYAVSSVADAGRVSKLAGKTVGSEMNGYYFSAGYDIIPHILPGSEHALIPFVFYEAYNTHAAVASGFTANKAYDRKVTAFGVSYKPHSNIAFKFDVRDNENAAGTGNNQWNVAVNYLF